MCGGAHASGTVFPSSYRTQLQLSDNQLINALRPGVLTGAWLSKCLIINVMRLRGEYKQQLEDEWLYQGHLVSPYSMDLECDGKTKHFDSEDRSTFENPCNHDYWHYQNATGREPAMSIYIITNEHIDKWFSE